MRNPDNRNPKIFARVDAALLERVQREAERRFDGNQSLLLRKAIIDHLDLTDALGPSYDLEVHRLKSRSGDATEAAA